MGAIGVAVPRRARLSLSRIPRFCCHYATRNQQSTPTQARAPPKPTRNQPQTTAPPARARPFITPEAGSFYRRDGTFATTPENHAWFRKTGILPGNHHKWPMDGAAILQDYKAGFAVFFSDRHYIEPVHQKHFAPHPEPAAPPTRARYERRLRDRPLWVFALIAAQARAVVRGVAKAKLVGLMHEAAERLAKEETPVVLRGTVLFHITGPLEVLDASKEELLDAFTTALRREAGRFPGAVSGNVEKARRGGPAGGQRSKSPARPAKRVRVRRERESVASHEARLPSVDSQLAL